MLLTQLKCGWQLPCHDVCMLWSGSPGKSWSEVCDRTGVVVLVQPQWSLLTEPSSTVLGAALPRDFTEVPDIKPLYTAFSLLLQSQLGDAARKELSLHLVLCVLVPQSGNCKSSLPSLILTPRPAFVFHCSLL